FRRMFGARVPGNESRAIGEGASRSISKRGEWRESELVPRFCSCGPHHIAGRCPPSILRTRPEYEAKLVMRFINDIRMFERGRGPLHMLRCGPGLHPSVGGMTHEVRLLRVGIAPSTRPVSVND